MISKRALKRYIDGRIRKIIDADAAFAFVLRNMLMAVLEFTKKTPSKQLADFAKTKIGFPLESSLSHANHEQYERSLYSLLKGQENAAKLNSHLKREGGSELFDYSAFMQSFMKAQKYISHMAQERVRL